MYQFSRTLMHYHNRYNEFLMQFSLNLLDAKSKECFSFLECFSKIHSFQLFLKKISLNIFQYGRKNIDFIANHFEAVAFHTQTSALKFQEHLFQTHAQKLPEQKEQTCVSSHNC